MIFTLFGGPKSRKKKNGLPAEFRPWERNFRSGGAEFPGGFADFPVSWSCLRGFSGENYGIYSLGRRIYAHKGRISGENPDSPQFSPRFRGNFMILPGIWATFPSFPDTPRSPPPASAILALPQGRLIISG
jgi:hypothetical protein